MERGNSVKNYNFSGAQDWSKYFDTIFKTYKVNHLLEFGLGDGTEFLLDNCETVTSVEISLGDYNKSWHDKCVEKYKNYQNWNVHYIDAPKEVVEANQEAIDKRYPINYTQHLPKLKEIVDKYTKKTDMIFIDAGFHNRGDLVNLCFNKAKIIAAHDSSRDEGRVLKNIYGYNIVNIPDNYLEFHFEDTYMGTTIWVDKELTNVIEALNGLR